MKTYKRINTDAVRQSSKSWNELCATVLSEARAGSEVVIDTELLEELFEHCFYAGYIEARREVFAERKQEAAELGIDIGEPLEWRSKDFADPYPYGKM